MINPELVAQCNYISSEAQYRAILMSLCVKYQTEPGDVGFIINSFEKQLLDSTVELCDMAYRAWSIYF